MNALQLWRQCHRNLALNPPSLTTMRGNPHADTLLIAPPCDDAEYASQAPFSNQAARTFHDWLLETMDLNTQDELFIVSCSLFGAKPKPASVEPVGRFVDACVAARVFKRYLVVGGPAYQAIFNPGRARAPFLAGQVLYPTRLMTASKSLPLFCFPDISALVNNVEREFTRESWLAQEAMNSLIHTLEARILPAFRKFWETT